MLNHPCRTVVLLLMVTDIIQPVVDQPVDPDCRILSGVVNRTDSGLALAAFASRHRRLYNEYLGPLFNLKPQ
uniref:Secreted protein n=1 Tax=Parascaris equorum TaxID=6256 RepID=A0A914RJL1_PAREQ